MAKDDYSGIGGAGQQPTLKEGEFKGVGTFAPAIASNQQQRNNGCAQAQSDIDKCEPDPTIRSFNGTFENKTTGHK